MGKVGRVLLLVVIVGLAATGWQIAWCKLENSELREELQSMAAQNQARLGLAAPPPDDDIRSEIIRRAKEHDIRLEPANVTVQRIGDDRSQGLYLATNHDCSISLLAFSFDLHFTTEAKGAPIQRSPDAR